jgi:glycosyltransferase involved in cell wall biosynthesis
MKVLILTSWYPNSSSPVKGIFIRNHAHAIRSAGVEVRLLALVVNPSKKWFSLSKSRFADEEGMITYLIEINSRLSDFIHWSIFYQYLLIKRYYFKHIEPEFKPDIIHSNVIYPTAVMGHWLAKNTGKKHIITEHWSKVDKFMRKPYFSKLGLSAYNKADAITTVSGFLRQKVLRYLRDPAKVTVIPNVVNLDLFRDVPARDPGEMDLSFICVATWSPPKRPDLIFQALERVSGTLNKSIVLNVVGEGPLLQELRIRKWSFKINYLGYISQKELVSAFGGSNYFLHASDLETFSVVIAEAHASGLPVLASDVAAIPELINPSNGMVCPNTVEAWTDTLQKMIANEYDRIKVRSSSFNFNQKDIGQAFIDLYNRII